MFYFYIPFAAAGMFMSFTMQIYNFYFISQAIFLKNCIFFFPCALSHPIATPLRPLTPFREYTKTATECGYLALAEKKQPISLVFPTASTLKRLQKGEKLHSRKKKETETATRSGDGSQRQVQRRR